jgi:hypothetical protein
LWPDAANRLRRTERQLLNDDRPTRSEALGTESGRWPNPRIQLGSLRNFAMFSKAVPPFRSFWAIEITTEFLFVGMALAT